MWTASGLFDTFRILLKLNELRYVYLNSLFRNILVLSGCLLWVTATAQRQGNIWYFGNYAGLDFNSGAPVPLLNSAMTTNEGCASIANKQGQLLFYTNGINVWDRTHVTMPNGTGLLGHPSSTQCGVIVPRPAKVPTVYYVFSVDDHGGFDGLRYSIVDMTLNGGFGDVTAKNVPLLSPTTEKVTAVRHGNQRDIWVITHEWNSNKFYAWLVDSVQLHTTGAYPVISATGSVHTGSNLNTMGYMKVSPDGQWLAVAIHGQHKVEVFQFDDSTGVVSNPMSLQLPSWLLTYGIEFSPSGQYLYVSTVGSNELHQFDMWAGGQAAIQSSAVLLSNVPQGADYGALQLARDGKIYMAIPGSPSLSVIRKPNEPGLLCQYFHQSVSLGGRVSFYGLPTFVQSFFAAADFDYEFECYGDSTHFFLTDTTDIDSVKWDFGDPLSGPNNFSSLMEPMHLFTSSDSFTVSLIFFGNGIIDTLTRKLFIHPRASLDLGNDTTICNGLSLVLDATNPEATYLWSDGSTDSTLTVTLAGAYWVQVTNYCDTLTDAINITYAPLPTVSLGNDTAICAGDSLVLNATYPGATYLWHDSTTAPTHTAIQTGMYSVTVDNGCAQVSDSVGVTYIPPVALNLGNDTVICPGEQVYLYAGHPGSTYQWSTGSQQPDLFVSTAGTYWVVVTNICETAQDTIVIQQQQPPAVELGNDTVICAGTSITLNAYFPGSTVLWSTGDTTASIVTSVADLYWVQVVNECGFDQEFKDVAVLQPPAVQFPNDTTACPGFSVTLDIPVQTATVTWHDGGTGWTVMADQPNTYWAQVVNMCGSAGDTFVLDYYPAPQPYLGRDTALCFDAPYVLDAGAGTSYLWSDGSTQPTLAASTPGGYWVIVTNQYNCSSGDSVSLFLACPPVVLVPTGFTPNGDGMNDEFNTYSKHITYFHVQVFDRWGTLIFESDDVSRGWDGTFGGRKMPIGSYAFLISYRDLEGVPYQRNGNVTLIR